MNTTYFRIELARVTRDFMSMFFTAILPAFLYVIFGAVQEYGSTDIGKGNVSAYVMIGMAAYGAVTATVSIGGAAAVEQMQGWGRQLGLTPLTDTQRIVTKAAVAFVIAIIPVALIYVIGALTGAEAEPGVWIFSGLFVLLGAAVFSFFGLMAGLLFRSEGAVGAASGSLVILAFLGNLFFPLDGVMLDIARFTPLYGIVALARYPLTEGYLASTTGGAPSHDDLWVPIVNIIVWGAVFVIGTILISRRGRARQ
ncbi:MAG: ABC transporter permease [Microbacterium gubbeenense]|uniref:ABC transporter permease n=1 Tax=Microbacterium gubbeenense TaxID=159896 RepID=UPI00040169D1|nr:ABC transporter permease [Microbacterium gubbeenense]